MTDIQRVKLGVDNCYLIREAGSILVDGGMPGRERKFAEDLKRMGRAPEEIDLILLTHAHWDHCGSARGIQELSHAPIALHAAEQDWLEQGLYPLPPGVTPWGRTFVWIMSLFMSRIVVPPAQVDWVLEGEASLDEYGIAGRIIPTPGHSPGSVTLLLATGDAFVGDLAMAGFPLRWKPGLPILAEDMDQVRGSWIKLIDAGARTIHPAHGKSFSVDVIRRALIL